MLHDESIYEDPYTFKPSRFLKSDGTIDPDILDPRTMFFGFGKRCVMIKLNPLPSDDIRISQCPGRGIAEGELFITIACILKVFDILLPLDENGSPYTPETKYESGVIRYVA